MRPTRFRPVLRLGSQRRSPTQRNLSCGVYENRGHKWRVPMQKLPMTSFTGRLQGKGCIWGIDKVVARKVGYLLFVRASNDSDAVEQVQKRVSIHLSSPSRLFGYKVCGTEELTLVMNGGVRQDFRAIAETKRIEPID